MVLVSVIALFLHMFPVEWQEVEVIFNYTDQTRSFSLLLPAGFQQVFYYDSNDDDLNTVLFLYSSGAFFYITKDGNLHPNARNLKKKYSVLGPGKDFLLVGNEMLKDSGIQAEYSIPDEIRVSGYNLCSRWWGDYQTFVISYGYSKASKKWKARFEKTMASIKLVD